MVKLRHEDRESDFSDYDCGLLQKKFQSMRIYPNGPLASTNREQQGDNDG